MPLINEGLQPNDLDDLVLSTLSVDEFDSKIDTDAIVLAFYVIDESPAEDLSYFIETGGYEILDTEVSPAPDENGNYLVFVEFLRNNDFYKNAHEILEDIENLVGIDAGAWNFTFYHGDGEEAFNYENVRRYVRLDKVTESKLSEHDCRLFGFLKNSVLDDVKLSNSKVKLTKGNQSVIFEKIALGDSKLLNHLLQLSKKPVALDSESLYECSVIKNMLGNNWDVEKISEKYILSNTTDKQILILETVKKN